MVSSSSLVLSVAVTVSAMVGSARATSSDDSCVFDYCGSELTLCTADAACGTAVNMSGVTTVPDCYFDVAVWAYCYANNCTSLFTNLTDCYSGECVECMNTTSAESGVCEDCEASYDACMYANNNCSMEVWYSGVANASDCQVQSTYDSFCGGDYECSEEFGNLTTCYVNLCAECVTTTTVPSQTNSNNGGGGSSTTAESTAEGAGERGAAVAGISVSRAGLMVALAAVAAAVCRW